MLLIDWEVSPMPVLKETLPVTPTETAQFRIAKSWHVLERDLTLNV